MLTTPNDTTFTKLEATNDATEQIKQKYKNK